MSGFGNIAAWATAPDLGRYHLTTFRKAVASAATAANDFIDYTYSAGNPPANFYASSPLEAAYIETIRGINVPQVTPYRQFIKSITVMSAAASATTITSQNQRMVLCDYLLYYPFIDTDAVGEVQETTQPPAPAQPRTLPRYTTGEGVQMMAVAQSASSAYGTFTVSYTNSEGTPGRTSQTTYSKVVGGGGILVSSTNAGVPGSQPFIQLMAGDKGVRSIQSVTFTAAGGGLMSLVLVKPLQHFYTTQECRRTTSSTLDSFGAASQFESVLHRPPVQILDGAVLGIVSLGNAGSLASSILTGVLETQWS